MASASGHPRSSIERRGILFIISAPSGTGKTTLCKQLTANLPGLWHSISYTTRKPRPGEEHGREYYFIGEQTFREMIARHEFVEWAQVYGHLYGTPRKSLAEKIEQVLSSFVQTNVLKPATVEEYFTQIVKSVYIVEPYEGANIGALHDQLSADRMFTFPFSWRGGIEYDNAYLIGAGGEAFMVVGKQAEFQFIKLNQATVLENSEEEEISADDLDFDLM